ncbi:MAG: fibronectin type III domain-containing protein [Lachnospiraceae bacterium]|nr:fibronectin type III domain-containing protein [Lachnospiraceae bacterium]
MIKKINNFLLTMVMVLSMLVTTPMSVSALVYPSWPTDEDIEAAIAEKNFPKPENLRVVGTTGDSITISWKYAEWGYSLFYTDDPNQEPVWTEEYTTRTDGSTGDWKVTINKLTPGKTYYFYVKHATIDVVKMHAVYLSGEYSMIKAELKENNSISGKEDNSKADNPITVKATKKTIKASELKKGKQIVKPLKIKNAEGTVKVTKIKSGTAKKIYSKIKVNKKTGAITLKKGTYKKGNYKVVLKIEAYGNLNYNAKTLKKTVKLKIK